MVHGRPRPTLVYVRPVQGQVRQLGRHSRGAPQEISRALRRSHNKSLGMLPVSFLVMTCHQRLLIILYSNDADELMEVGVVEAPASTFLDNDFDAEEESRRYAEFRRAKDLAAAGATTGDAMDGATAGDAMDGLEDLGDVGGAGGNAQGSTSNGLTVL